MMCMLTERWLRPGAFAGFRDAWEPDVQPEGLTRAYHLRDRDDPDHVISFGFFDLDRGGFEALMGSGEVREMQARRMAAMAPFVARTGVDAVFEVADVVEPTG